MSSTAPVQCTDKEPAELPGRAFERESLLQKNMSGFQLKRVYMVYEKEEDKWTTWWGTIINPVTWMMAFGFRILTYDLHMD